MTPTLITITVAAVGVLGSLGGIWWKSWYDAREKEKDRKHAAQAEYLKEKRQAGAVLLKTFSKRLQVFFIMEDYFEKVVAAKELKEILLVTKELYEENPNETGGPTNDERLEVIQSYYAHFAQDPAEIPNREAEIDVLKQKDKEYDDMSDAYLELVTDSVELYKDLQRAAHDTPAEYERVSGLIATRMIDVQTRAEWLLTLTKQEIKVWQGTIVFTRKQMGMPDNNPVQTGK